MSTDPTLPPAPAPAPAEEDDWSLPRRENAVVTWARAIVLGIQDTAKDVLAEGRKGANDAYDEYWRRFDRKTKRRR